MSAALWNGCAGSEVAHVENAVLICLDTVRYDTLTLVRDAHGEDAAARRRWNTGTRLVRAQSPAPWTLPAVASAFTGVYPNRHLAGSFQDRVADLSKSFPLPLARDRRTVFETLSASGFETVGVVAHPWFQTLFGLERGFASLDVELEAATDRIDRAAAWLDARSAREDAPPFFLYLHFMDAHGPMHLDRKRLRQEVARLSPRLRTRAIASNPAVCAKRASLGCLRFLGYISAVSDLFDAVASVLDQLEVRGLLANTVVVAFSDHGEEFLEHAAEEKSRALDPRGSHGLGHGHTLYQEQLHVPIVIWHPAIAPGDADLPASLVDLAPTLLGWLGVEAERELDGEDLGAQLAGTLATDPERPLFSSSVAFGPEREAVVRGGQKRISDGGSGAGALHFSLETDPLEREPLNPDADRHLASLLSTYRERRAQAEEAIVPTPEQLEQLQALGYLEDVTAP